MYVWDDKKKQYVSDTPASRIPVKDSAELFDSNNVEGALAELAGERDAQGITLQDHTGKIENLSEAVDWLKANGGGGGGTGGGGTVMPTITTTDELSQVVPKGQEIVLNVFFSSPNLGQGSLVLLVNNKEVNSFTIKQGSNSINIGALKDLRNKIVIYAKDRANLVSNEITYNIINGGVSLTLDFDYYADYPADKNVLMRYNIDTDQEDVQLEVTVDNNKSSVACKNGYNEYYFKNLTVGIHAVTVRAVSGQFISETYSFNLVIINSDSLYISSTFGENPKCTLGVPVVIDYRISYKDDTAVTLVLTLDGKVNKTLTSKRGSYAWTLNDMTLGSHSYKIDCTLGADTVSLEGTFVVEAGDYTPLQINTDGLRYQMGCANRTNQDNDKEQFIYDNGVSQITTTLHGFNFETNGWIDGALVCNGGAYAEIDYACMADNAPYSLTVEIDFKATDIGIQDARVLECRDADTKKGFHVALTEAKLNSISQEAKVYITPEERTTVSLQIDRQNKFAKVYVNGIITSAFKLTDSGSGTATVLESFAHNGKIYVGCDKNLDNIGNCTIYDIRVYERRVSNDEIVKNVIAQEKDLRKQEDLYNFCFNNNTLSTMRLYSDEVENKVSNMTNTNKITMRAVYRSTNTEKYGQPFELKYCKVYWQGTSSLDYIRKNYNLELYDDDLKEFYYSPYPNAVQEYLFCLKCDYMESSHARNVGIGNLINKYWYTSKNPAQLKNDMVQNAVQGFPMLLYINDEFMGVYNFNTDRYSNASFGYTGDNCLAYELSANSDTTAGAFITYDKTKHEGNEIDYYKRDFMCLYPPTRRAGNDTMDEIISLVKFVDKSSDEEFVTNINNNVYFNKEYLLRYLIYCLVMGAVDSLGKNMKLATWDNGTTWYPQIYDCDTTMGLDNSGMLYYTDSSMKIQAGTYNTSSSRLWSRLIELMWADIQAEYVKMRNTYLTLDNLYSCIIDNQMDLIPATYYNSDCETKYLQFGALYLDVLHGQGRQQVREWLRARLLFLDTYMEYWTTTSEFISLRAGKDGLAYIDLEMFDNMYAQIKWRNTGKEDDALAIQIKEVKKNTVTRFEFKVQASTDQEIRIFGANYVKSLGDLSNLELVKIDVSNATRLTKMECHSEKLKNVSLSGCTTLQEVNLKDCSILGATEQSTKIVDLSKCVNLRSVDCRGTQLQGINLGTKGTNVESIGYPKAIQVIEIVNCVRLKRLDLEHGNECKEMTIRNCPNIEAFGDREYDEATGKYKYENGYFLSGIQSVTLDNSAIGLEYFDITYCKNLQSVVLKNMPNIKAFYIGINVLDEAIVMDKRITDRTYNLDAIKKAGALKFEVLNVPKLKDFYITCGLRKSSKDKIGYGATNSLLLLNTLDLSQLPIENLYIYNMAEILNLKLPYTLKKFIRHPYMDYEPSYTGQSTLYDNWNKERIYNTYYTKEAYTTYGTGAEAGSELMAHSGGLIHNMWCPSVKGTEYIPPTETPFTWDLEGLTFSDFYAYGDNYVQRTWDKGTNQYSDNKIDIKNLKCKPKNYVTPFNNTWINSVQGLIDLSEYQGVSMQYALAYTTGLQVTLPTGDTPLPSVKYWSHILYNTNNDQIEWGFVEKIMPRINETLTDILHDTCLKEQKSEEEKIDIINKKFTGTLDFKENLWGKNCNLKYIGTFNISATKGNNNGYGLFYKCNFPVKVDRIIQPSIRVFSEMFRESAIEEVGEIIVDLPATTGVLFSTFFWGCTELKKIGNITINCDTPVNMSNFATRCSNLIEVGNITGKIKSLYSSFDGCSALTSIGDIDLTYVETLYRAFYQTKLETLNFLGTFTSIQNMESTFAYSSLKSTNLVLNIENITTLASCFRNSQITELNFVGTLGNSVLGSMASMCIGCTKLTNINGLSKFPKSVWSTASVFNGCINLTTFLNWDASINYKCDITRAYEKCSGITGDLEITLPYISTGWDLWFMGGMSQLENVKIRLPYRFETTSPNTFAGFTDFGNCSKLKVIEFDNTLWDSHEHTPSKTDCRLMIGAYFNYCVALQTIKNYPLNNTVTENSANYQTIGTIPYTFTGMADKKICFSNNLCPNYNSYVDLLTNHLATVTDSPVIYIPVSHYNQLSEELVASVISKGWTMKTI